MNESWNRSCGSFIFVFVFSLARPAPYTTISLYGTHVLSAAFYFFLFRPNGFTITPSTMKAIKDEKENSRNVFGD